MCRPTPVLLLLLHLMRMSTFPCYIQFYFVSIKALTITGYHTFVSELLVTHQISLVHSKIHISDTPQMRNNFKICTHIISWALKLFGAHDRLSNLGARGPKLNFCALDLCT